MVGWWGIIRDTCTALAGIIMRVWVVVLLGRVGQAAVAVVAVAVVVELPLWG
jgi:hypothetical protein